MCDELKLNFFKRDKKGGRQLEFDAPVCKHQSIMEADSFEIAKVTDRRAIVHQIGGNKDLSLEANISSSLASEGQLVYNCFGFTLSAGKDKEDWSDESFIGHPLV